MPTGAAGLAHDPAERLIAVPGRIPFARRAPATAPGAERTAVSVPDSPVSAPPVRHTARWTVSPGSQDDEWLHRNRRHPLTRTDGPTTLKRPAVRAAPPDAASTSAPRAAAGTAAGRKPLTRDFSGISARRSGHADSGLAAEAGLDAVARLSARVPQTKPRAG